MPVLPARLYPRARRARARSRQRTWLRATSSSMRTGSTAPTSAYLTGFDPRFEEAVLIARRRRASRRSSSATSARARPAQRRCRCACSSSRTSSLPGQPRDRSRALGGHPRVGGHRARTRASASSAGRATRTGAGSRSRRSSSTRCAAASAPKDSSRTPTTCSSTRPTACAPSTRSSSWRPSSTPPATPLRASSGCSAASGPGMTEQEAVPLLGWNGLPSRAI